MENEASVAEVSSRRRRNRFVLTLTCILLFGVLVFGLSWLGRPVDWRPIRWAPSSSLEGFLLDRSTLGPQGKWLLWFDSSLEAVCAKDLGRQGAVVALHPGDCFAVAPVALVEGDLIALRSQRTSIFLLNLIRGLKRILGRGPDDPGSRDPRPTVGSRTTFLERIDLRTGNVVARSAALSTEAGSDNPSDFELGRLSFSPGGDRFAYWSAQEELGSSPLEATVTEVLRVYKAGTGFTPLVDRTITSPGNFFVRSSFLTSVGRPLWAGRETCLFVSFLDNGSLIPFDVPSAEFEATYSLAEVYRKLVEENPSLQYGPEGIETLKRKGDSETTLLFWGRGSDSVHFFHFDYRLRFLRETVVETESYEFETSVWLARSERLLVDDKTRNRLVALSPRGDSGEAFPLPPDWREGFRILGEDSSGALVGTNRRIFLKTSKDRRDWETIPLF